VQLSDLLKYIIDLQTNELGDLRHNLAKVEVASSSLVSRSRFLNQNPGMSGVCCFCMG